MGEHAAFWLALASLAAALVADGGRRAEVMPFVVLACLPAVVCTSPWRRVHPAALCALAFLPVAAIAVSMLTPMQFSYARDLSVWSLAAMLFACVASYCRTEERRACVVLAVVLLGFAGFCQALTPWIGAGRPTKAMVGLFYQQDMFGGFCAGIALVAITTAVAGRGWLRLIAAAITPFVVAGCVLSTSRAAQALLVLGLLAVLLLAAASAGRWNQIFVWLSLVLLSGGALVLLTGQWFFPESGGGSPFQGTLDRSGSDSLSSSSSIRQAYWRAAWSQFLDEPLLGEGFGAFGATFFERAPVGAFGSRYAHNGLLQGLGEGGLLFGLPLLLLSTAMVLLALRVLLRQLQGDPGEAGRSAAALGALALFGHSLVDFDWSFPTLAGLLAVCGGAALATQRNASSRTGVTATAVLIIASTSSAYAVSLWVANDELLWARASAADLVAAANEADSRGLPNPVLWAAALGSTSVSALTDREVERAVARTAELAAIDPNVQMARAAALVRVGRVSEGLAVAGQTIATTRDSRPNLLSTYAAMLAQNHRKSEAVDLLSREVDRLATPGFPLPDNVWRLVVSLQEIAGPDTAQSACAYAAARAAFGPGSVPREAIPPKQTLRCT